MADIRHLGFSVTAAALLALGLAGMPVQAASDKTVSKSEIKRAQQLHVQITQSQGVYPDPAVNDYVQQLGLKMAAVSDMPGLEWYFTVLDTNDINAFTTGGGYVYVSRGLMAYLDSEAELAAVLGHEIGHVTAKHQSRQQTQGTLANVASAAAMILTRQPALGDLTSVAGTAIVRGYGRDMELEADEIGARYLARAGYDPEAMIRVVATLKEQEQFEKDRARAEGREPRIYHGVFATHPDNDSRLKEVIAAAGVAKTTATGEAENRERYLHAINGLAFGSSRGQGMVRDNRFYHANFQFTMAFPQDWLVDNNANELVAVSPDKHNYLQLTAQGPPPGVTSPRDFARRALGDRRLDRAEELEINGLDAYTAIVRGDDSPYGKGANVRYVFISFNNLMWIIRGASRSDDPFPAGDVLFMSAAKTFRQLRSNEFRLAEPYRIRIVKVPDDTTMEYVASRSPLPKYSLEEHRLINGLYPDGEPTAGEYIKFIR